MPSAPDLPYDPLEQLRADGIGYLGIVADHGLEPEVPTCPGWDLGDLTWHLGNVWHRFGRVVADGLTTFDEFRAIERPERPDDELLIDWATTAHTALHSALVSAESETPIGSWAGTQDVCWLRRRMAQETALHRWDAAHAVGVPYEIPTPVAADGIDEFLMWFAGRRHDPDAAPVGGTVHLHCTDTVGRDDDHSGHGGHGGHGAGRPGGEPEVVGEWLVTTLDERGATFTREHAKGDAAVRGPAHDLLLWVWRRPGRMVEIIGDTGVAERFQAYSKL